MVLNHQKNLIVEVMASVMQKFCQIAKNSTSEDLKEHMPKEHPPPPPLHTTVPFCILKSTSNPLTILLEITVKRAVEDDISCSLSNLYH